MIDKLFEKLVEADFEDTFKPADKNELEVRKQELLDSLDGMAFDELEEIARNTLLDIDDERIINRLYDDWVEVDKHEELLNAVNLLRPVSLKAFINDCLDN